MSQGRTSTDAETSFINRVNDRLNMRMVFLIYAIAATIFVYTPSLTLIVFSFNEGGITFPFTQITFDWYNELLNNTAIIDSLVRSLQLAIVVTIITTILATITALAFHYDLWGGKTVLYLLILGIITPGVTYGIGASLFLNNLLGLPQGLWMATPVHVVWALPFSVIFLIAGFPPDLPRNEDAARVMGANRFTAFREVILPQIAPTVLGAAVFAFTLSYNEGTRGLLLIGQATTLPLQVFAVASSQRITPNLFALGALTTIFSTILLLVSAGLVYYSAQRTR